MESIDHSRKRLTIIDIGAGNGRNSVEALKLLYKNHKPKSRYTVHCMDNSIEALKKLNTQILPEWIDLRTHQLDLETQISLPKADFILLYGIFECLGEKSVVEVLSQSNEALRSGGCLVIVTLVQGEGILDIKGEIIRPEDYYTDLLERQSHLHFLDMPTVTKKTECHDVGNGYPEDHLHYVYRTVLTKTSNPKNKFFIDFNK